jgi:hypothetical protein
MLQVMAPAVTSSSGGGGCSSSNSTGDGAVSSFKQWPGYIYLIALSDTPDVTRLVMQQLLRPLLTNQELIKVMHDPRQDAAVLQQQYGVELQGVLDTQLLPGQVAAEEVQCPAAGAGEAAAGIASCSSSSNWCSWHSTVHDGSSG